MPLPRQGELVSFKRSYRPAHNVGNMRFVECQALESSGAPSGVVMPFADVLVPYDRALRGDADLRLVAVERIPNAGHIEERYDLDSDGLIAVTVTDLETRWSRTYKIGK